MTLHTVLLDIMEQAQRDGRLRPGVDADSSATAVFIVLKGLADHGATSGPDDYHGAVEATNRLIGGTLFN